MSEQPPVPPPPPSSSSCLQTALHRAAMVGNSDVIAALIQGGCALDLQDRDGNTALHEASWHGFSQCVKPLVKAGADASIRNKAGDTALHLACQNAHAQTARLLLLLGGSGPDLKNHRGDTCLHVAARYNNLTLTKMLLSSLCSVSERNKAGDTALHVAAALNHRRAVQLLLEAGADGTARNYAGQTALDKAREQNHRDVALLLARAPQVRRFTRGRTLWRRRERLRVERRTQSVPRVDLLPHKVARQEPGGAAGGVEVLRCRRSAPQAAGEQEKVEVELLRCDSGRTSAPNRPTYQLYTLYRDRDGHVRQAPARSCNCQPQLEKLQGQLKATREEMRLHVLNVQQEVSSRLSKMERRSRHQIKILDLLNQERASAERRNLVCLIEQRASEGREEVHLSQAVVSRELKRWCVSQLQDLDRDPDQERRGGGATPRYSKLLMSASSSRSDDGAAVPLLSVLSADSGGSLATYVNVLPSSSSCSLAAAGQQSLGRAFTQTAGDQRDCARFPTAARRPSVLPLASDDPCWQPREVQVPLSVDGVSSDRDTTSSRHGRKQLPLLPGAPWGSHANASRTLEVFIERSGEDTFSQERNSLHAMEVTQRFFETVSTQLERWYERKVAQVEQQAALRAQQDQKMLLQRIGELEEELERLRVEEKVGVKVEES